jgi:hypothetical protein
MTGKSSAWGHLRCDGRDTRCSTPAAVHPHARGPAKTWLQKSDCASFAPRTTSHEKGGAVGVGLGVGVRTRA